MGDNRSEPSATARTQHTIAGFLAACTAVAVGTDRLAMWTVADLERYVDRDALLRAEDPPSHRIGPTAGAARACSRIGSRTMRGVSSISGAASD
jgi:hypothetical protein